MKRHSRLIPLPLDVVFCSPAEDVLRRPEPTGNSVLFIPGPFSVNAGSFHGFRFIALLEVLDALVFDSILCYVCVCQFVPASVVIWLVRPIQTLCAIKHALLGQYAYLLLSVKSITSKSPISFLLSATNQLGSITTHYTDCLIKYLSVSMDSISL